MPIFNPSRGVSRTRRAVRTAVLTLCFAFAGFAPEAIMPAVRADEFLSQINKGYLAVSEDKRSDLVILPLLAKLDPPPARFAELSQAALYPADLPGFAEAKEWAEKPAQRAMLDALEKVSKGTKWKDAFAWALPYGIEGVPTELVEARLYSELGDPPTLGAARHYWLPELEKVACLVNVEATRLAADGKPSEAVDVLLRWANLSRQILDRQMMVEARWGASHLLQALERVRDVLYTDMTGKRQLDVNKIADQVGQFANDSVLDMGRMQLPKGDCAAANQVAARVFGPTGKVNERLFGPTLARLGASEQPLRLFSESARWRSGAAMHADATDTISKITSVQNDFAKRWGLGWFDRQQSGLTEHERLRSARFALISRTMPDLRELIDLRQILNVELQGTQLSLALAGYVVVNKGFPPQLTAIRPRWIDRIPADPFSRDVVSNQRSIPAYLIPMRRHIGMGEKEQPKPHEMDIVPVRGEPFSVKLTDTTFLMYSVGGNSANDFAKRVQNTVQAGSATDYLLWPPVISLSRQHQRDSQQLK
ncbi:MAG: hypothetical protein ACOYN0_04005 [Phycisphaerales bacterium]